MKTNTTIGLRINQGVKDVMAQAAKEDGLSLAAWLQVLAGERIQKAKPHLADALVKARLGIKAADQGSKSIACAILVFFGFFAGEEVRPKTQSRVTRIQRREQVS